MCLSLSASNDSLVFILISFLHLVLSYWECVLFNFFIYHICLRDVKVNLIMEVGERNRLHGVFKIGDKPPGMNRRASQGAA